MLATALRRNLGGDGPRFSASCHCETTPKPSPTSVGRAAAAYGDISGGMARAAEGAGVAVRVVAADVAHRAGKVNRLREAFGREGCQVGSEGEDQQPRTAPYEECVLCASANALHGWTPSPRSMSSNPGPYDSFGPSSKVSMERVKPGPRGCVACTAWGMELTHEGGPHLFSRGSQSRACPPSCQMVVPTRLAAAC